MQTDRPDIPGSGVLRYFYTGIFGTANESNPEAWPHRNRFRGKFRSPLLQLGNRFIHIFYQKPEVVQAEVTPGRTLRQIILGRRPENVDGQAIEVNVDPGLSVGLNGLDHFCIEHPAVILSRGLWIPAHHMKVIELIGWCHGVLLVS